MKINSSIKKILSLMAGPSRLYVGSLDDARRFKKYSYYFRRNRRTTDNLRGEMTFYYHAIEKGLCHSNIRLGFGKKKVQHIFFLINEWIKDGNDLNDSRFLASVGVIRRYIQVHHEFGYNVDSFETQLKNLDSKLDANSLTAGEQELTRKEILENSSSEFPKFVDSRHSVRDFGTSEISINRLKKAITIANRYPSVCNRQAIKTYTIVDKELITEALNLQGGIHGMAKNISFLIVITSDIQYFGRFNERNQSFVDGGIYLMNLLYGLTYCEIASCALNADLNLTKMRRMRKMISIPDSENIVSFVACGSYPEKFKVPISNRDTELITNTVIR